jgi:tetratricopeptide (TPR) repeat protein
MAGFCILTVVAIPLDSGLATQMLDDQMASKQVESLNGQIDHALKTQDYGALTTLAIQNQPQINQLIQQLTDHDGASGYSSQVSNEELIALLYTLLEVVDTLNVAEAEMPATFADLYRAWQLEQQGLTAQKNDDFKAALTAFKGSLALRQAHLPTNHLDLARNNEQLATLLRLAGLCEQAEPFAEQAVAGYRAHGSQQEANLSESLNTFGLILQELHRYTDAETAFKEALAINERVYGHQNAHVATVLNNLALVMDATGRYDEAEKCYADAFTVLKAIDDADEINVATTISNYASLLNTLGRHKDAHELNRLALTIRRKVLPNNHRDIATSLNNLGITLHYLDQFSAAELLLREALMIEQAILPAYSPELAITLNNLGLVLHEQEQLDEAEKMYQQALEVAQGSQATNQLWPVQRNLAVLYAGKQQPALSIFFAKQAVNNLQQLRQQLGQQAVVQKQFLATRGFSYEWLISLLKYVDRIDEMQQVQALFNTAGGTEVTATIPLTAFEQRQYDELERIAETIRENYAQLEALRQLHPTLRSTEEQAQFEKLEQQQRTLHGRYHVAFANVRLAFAQH